MENNKVKRSVPALAYLSILAISSTMFIINSTLVPLSAFYNTDTVHISWMISCLGIGRMVTQLVCGRLADKYGRKVISIIGMILVLLFFAVLPITKTLIEALILTVIGGMGFGMVNTSMLAVVFDCFAPVGKNATAQSYVQLFFAGGGVIVPFIAKRLLSNGLNWKFLYWGCGVYVLILLILLVLVKYPKQFKREAKESGFIVKPLLRKEGVILCASIFFIYSTGIVVSTWVSTFGSETFNMDSIEAIKLLTIYNLGSVIGTLVFAQLVKKFHGTILLVANSIVALTAFAICLITSSLLVFMIGIFIAGFVVAISFNIGISVGGELFPDNAATISGLLSVMSGTASLLVPIYAGALKNAYGIKVAFSTVIILLIIAIVVTTTLRKRYLYLKGSK